MGYEPRLPLFTAAGKAGSSALQQYQGRCPIDERRLFGVQDPSMPAERRASDCYGANSTVFCPPFGRRLEAQSAPTSPTTSGYRRVYTRTTRLTYAAALDRFSGGHDTLQ